MVLVDEVAFLAFRRRRRPCREAPGVHASAPVFAGTRIRVATVQRYLQQGYETDAILNAFPDLRVEDVDEARRQFAAVG